MKNAKYERWEHMIRNLEDGTVQEFRAEKSGYSMINAAKRASRKIQMELDGALGRGSVRLA